MRPTFELTLDVPGASSALRVARRFGVPADVVDRATEILPEQSRTFDTLVRELESQKARARDELAAAAEERARARALLAEVEAKAAKLRERDRAKLGQEAERLVHDVRQARGELKSARRKLRETPEAPDLEAARKALEAAAEAAARAQREAEVPPDAPIERVDEESLGIGQRVYVAHLRAEAEVIEGPSRGKVRVAAGPMKLWVDVADLRKGPRGAERGAGATRPTQAEAARSGAQPVSGASPRPSPPPAAPGGRPATPSSDNTLDVRGLRVDEALAMAEQFLDRAYGASQETVYILHGVGSGALRDALREHLAQDARYVRRLRPATHEEGGPRLTVVELR
jgi:DNA mismatch repair protein MutS2